MGPCTLPSKGDTLHPLQRNNMRPSVLLASILCSVPGMAQGPVVTSWIINPGGETGYGGQSTNVQTVAYTPTDVHVACSCIPGYDIGPWAGNPNDAANQDFVFKITRQPQPASGTHVNTPLGHIGVWRNGVSIFNAKDGISHNNQGIWNRNALVFEGASFDQCLGHPAPNGEYHHHVSPNCLYDHFDEVSHGDLIGYAFDGYPVYGAYGFTNTDGTGGIVRMRSSYRLRTITDRTTLPDGTVLPPAQHGPAIAGMYALGAFLEDHEYVPGLGDLDVHNGRSCVTPEYPVGTYAYFVTLDENLDPAFPYVLGPTYYGTVQPGNTGPQSGHNPVPGGAVVYDPSATSVAEVRATADITLYPVPVHDVLHVRATGALRSAALIDAQGRTVIQVRADGRETMLDLQGQASGVYTLRITLADGATIVRPFMRL